MFFPISFLYFSYYAEKYAKGKCDIYFMREASTPNKSLVPPIFYTTIVISLY